MTSRLARSGALGLLLVGLLWAAVAAAHGVADDDKGFIEASEGARLVPFLYLGAKHMVTGYDHLLFLFGVIFFLYRLKEVGLYVTLFAVGHSATLLFGVLSGTHVNAFLVDAIIGLSVVYKAFDNLGVFKRVLGFQPDTKAAVLILGCSTVLAWQPSCRTLRCPKTGWCRTCWPSTLAWSSASCWRLRPS